MNINFTKTVIPAPTKSVEGIFFDVQVVNWVNIAETKTKAGENRIQLAESILLILPPAHNAHENVDLVYIVHIRDLLREFFFFSWNIKIIIFLDRLRYQI